MISAGPHILSINGGSSGVKFAIYRREEKLLRILHGKIERLASGGALLTKTDDDGDTLEIRLPGVCDAASLAKALIDGIDAMIDFKTLEAVGHRIVHGMNHGEPEFVARKLLNELRAIIPCDPEHLPLEIDLIESIHRFHPALLQVVCFDSAFHRTMPRVASMLPIPRRFEASGIRRYGFHGLSCAYLMEELARVGDTAAIRGRVILAHLGSGASVTAVLDGRSVDTSMGFTPAAGLLMSTRAGDLDPGLVGYLARTAGMSAEGFDTMVNRESGLLGVSETSADLRVLLAAESTDIRAAEAVALFCYRIKKMIGAFTAALGGIDTLVFTGGIGENSPVIRSRVCEGLGFIGIRLDESKNAETSPMISKESDGVSVRVIHTDEELMIARSTAKMLTNFRGMSEKQHILG
jgi:acetate kinase